MTVVHHPEPIWDEHWQGFELAADGTHRYVWLWHGYNIRLVAVPKDDEMGYDHGWCYPRDPQLVQAAVAAWDPDTQDEPAGWHKRPTHPVRRAPHRDQQPDYNQPRCVHPCSARGGSGLQAGGESRLRRAGWLALHSMSACRSNRRVRPTRIG